MAINFPSTPTVGQTFNVGLKTYTWDGTRWVFDFRNLSRGTTVERPTVDKPYVYYNTTLRVYEVWRPEYEVWEALYTYPIIMSVVDPTITYSEASWTVPGTYQWECPAGVSYVHAVCVGGGGGAVNTSSTQAGINAAGTGGGLGWKNNIPVTPGNIYTVKVGAGGLSKYLVTTLTTANPGEDSYFINTNTVAGLGGGGGDVRSDRLGGSYIGDGGGAGGDCKAIPTGNYYSFAGAGAGGYSGKGGNGSYHNGSTYVFSDAGLGGGGGGGGVDTSTTYDQTVGGGGGVGIFGEGASGTRGFQSTAGGYQGGGGSGANTSTVLGDLNGGNYGGGAGAFYSGTSNQHAAGGAVRIIWGAGRAFPSTLTGVM